MRRLIFVLLAICFFSITAYAVDTGRADGSVTVDKTKINLAYAYAVGHQRNELSHRKDDTRIILTNKPLPDGVKLDEIDYSFPDGYLGLVVSVTHEDKVSHVVVQHPKGTYDADYFENDRNYHFKPSRGDSGTISGNLSSNKMTTNTMTFFFNVDFKAAVK
jgi:hypothetical protein